MRRRENNQIAGRKAKAAGSAFEAFLNTQHEIAQHLGILAYIDKIDPPAVVRKGRVEFGERTGADYVGMLGDAAFFDKGRIGVYFNASAAGYNPHGYVAIEAKSTADSRLYKSEVRKKQQEHLTAIARGGGLALLTVEFRGSDGWVVGRAAIPWLSIAWKTLKSAESIAPEDIEPWLIPISDGGHTYLERFHPRGTPLALSKSKRYARE